MKPLLFLVISIGLYAQAPTVAQKPEAPVTAQQKPDPRDSEIQQLRERVRLLENKITGLMQYFGADEGLRNLDKAVLQASQATVPAAPAK